MGVVNLGFAVREGDWYTVGLESVGVAVTVVAVIVLKKLGPKMGPRSARGPPKAGDEVRVGTKATSKIDRVAFKAEREAFWKAEAKTNPGKYTAEDLMRMESGQAPTGSDGHPMELHHVNRTPDGGLSPMSRTEHRLGENYKKNHP